MIKVFFDKSMILAVFLSFSFSVLTAQNKDTTQVQEYRNGIKTNVLGFFSGHVSLTYERVLNKKTSMLITCGILGDKKLSGDDAYEKYMDTYHFYSGFIAGEFKYLADMKYAFSFEYRYYLSHKNIIPPKGIHIGPSLDFYKLSETFSIFDLNNVEKIKKVNEYKLTTISVNIGFQFFVLKRVPINLLISPGYGIAQGKEEKSNINGAGFKLTYSLNCGLAF